MDTNAHPMPSAVAFKTGIARVLTRLTEAPKLLWLVVPVVAAISFVAFSASTAPVIPAIALSSEPLYAAGAGDKPALALALSVEFPTVGAQYVSGTSTDNSYTNTNEYLGYYDAESCYTYNNAPTETPVSPQTTTDFKRFDRTGAATNRKCTDAFSGNFLNWASSSAIDMLRLALTGGDRYIDTSTLTILQRAVVPNGDPICMWNSSNFPAKQLLKSGGASGTAYFGAVPTSMQTAAGTNDIWVGNTLNKIFFGTASGGSCGNTSSYTLGGAVSSSQMGTITSSNASLPSGTTNCAAENGTCSGFSGTKEIWYGANTSWKVAPATGSVSCTNGLFGDPLVGTAKNCYYKNYTGSWTPTVSASALNSDGFFYSRVQVCNVASGVLQDSRDYGLCKKYPNGNYKPTGAVQKYSDQLRLAAFGYLMDQTASYNSGGRYGGVLRAPIKYVGGKTFDDNGVDNTPTGGNPKAEWNESTGVFNTNPESDATYGKSGVVTYLNQFGRTGPVPGRYKKYDPVGELHYEALRYLQGLQPSADAISSITADMYDGFPVTTTWTDPYGGTRTNTADYSCLKSNIVVIGDINTHDGNRLPTANAASNIPDINAWRTVVQNFEKDISSAYIDGQGVSRTTGNPNGANNSVPSGSTTSQIMGSAYWAHTHDIRGTGWTGTGGSAKQRPGLRVKTFTFDVNEYGAQTNVSTRHYANQFFMASKYGGFETDASNPSKNPYNTKGNPFYRDDLTTGDKYVWEDTDTSTSRTGEANTYFLQSDARGVLKAFDDIFSRASTSARSIAGAAVQSKNLSVAAGNTIYQGAFDTSDWTGDLLALPVSVTASTATPPNVVTISATPTWSAATQLAAMTTPATTRNIVVGKVGATANPVATPFTWAGIETSLSTALDKATPASAADGLAQDRLNYLRGDSSKEGNPFRKRNKLLGDILNSGVAYSGVPATNIIDSGYATFQTTNASRTAAVFVGANDGMLHAFNATNGNELFAYIPSWLGPKLPALTSPTYVNNHQSFMDGTPVVAEALVASTWKTVLVAGTGGGGQGVFALDVTNPAAFDENKVMWEFTHADDPDMGNVIGRPQILKLRTSAYGATATYKWFAAVGSGVNNYVADSTGLFGSGYPALFLLDLAKPAGTAWSLGTNYYKISVPVNGNLDYLTSYVATGGTSLTASKATGLINFKATLGNAREVTQIFLGDLHGQLWKLDFSLLGIADWNMTKLSSFSKGTTPSIIPYPLYIAKDASGNAQPITMAPSIANGPIPGTRYVLFGTGKYLETSDKAATTQQSVYMVYDNASSSADASSPASAISSRLRLKQGTANASTGVITVPAFTLGRAVTNIDTELIRSGWYFDFPTSGERQISAAIFSGNSAIFGSLIPGVASTSGSCSAAAGGGNLYEVNFASGNGNSTASTVGLLGEPLVMEIPGATTGTPTDNTGRRLKTVTSRVMPLGSTGVSAGATTTKTVIVGRLSWRQINNFQDLKNAP
ncbi:MAG: PilC/PilY family type IV pilus protein [Gallionella sp.]|nr:PilC/PilY family type IV pilus protein [Gallionella sp.]